MRHGRGGWERREVRRNREEERGGGGGEIFARVIRWRFEKKKW
jgi:hypothetical protein